MSRAIKFRAWDKDDLKMIYDFGLTPGDYFPYQIPGPEVESDDPANYTYYDDAVLMQFTGFKGRRYEPNHPLAPTHTYGTEIYDKDILRYTNPAPGKKWRKTHGEINHNDMIVSWNKQRGCWGLFWKHQKTGELCWQSLAKALDEHHAVVGNAYENPELVA